MENIKHLGLSINDGLLKKMHYISKYNCRSGNGQILFLIRESILNFEKEHGKITNEMLNELNK